MLPIAHLAKNFPLGFECAGGSQMSSWHGREPFDRPEFARVETGIDVLANRAAGDFAHAPPQSIPHDCPFVNHRFTLEVSVPSEGHRLANPFLGIQSQRFMLRSVSRSLNDMIGLMTIFGCKPAMRGQDFAQRVDLFPIAGRMSSNLRCFFPAVAGALQICAYLLAARA
jgi:hypothetical protein